MNRSTFFKSAIAAIAAFLGFKKLPAKPKGFIREISPMILPNHQTYVPTEIAPKFEFLDLSGLRDISVREVTSFDNGKTWFAYSKDFPNVGDKQPITWEGSNPTREDLLPLPMDDSPGKFFIN